MIDVLGRSTTHINGKLARRHPESKGGSKGCLGASVPIQKCGSPVTSNEIHHADILTEVHASLGLQVQVCQ